MIASVHSSFVGHIGLERTLNRLKEIGETWEFQRQHFRHLIDRCPCCQKMSMLKIPNHANHFIISTYKLMECLNIDFVGIFPDGGYCMRPKNMTQFTVFLNLCNLTSLNKNVS